MFDAVHAHTDADGVSSEWDEFFHQIAPIAQSRPWMTCVGNHELDWPVAYSYFNSTDSGGECGIPQEKRFGMPNAQGPQSPWYSFDYGNVHVTMMSTEHDFMPGSPQHAWIMKDLESINRTKTPWTIFGGHRPFYVDSTWNAPPDGDGCVVSSRLLLCCAVLCCRVSCYAMLMVCLCVWLLLGGGGVLFFFFFFFFSGTVSWLDCCVRRTRRH